LVSHGRPKAWISREIGGAGRSLQIARTGGGLIRRESAEAIAALHARIGDRVPPARQWRTELPTLDAILAAEESGRDAMDGAA
jgi:hypothetical protein